ncbi:MAG: hypothetical protein ACRBM6_37275 [Geminicoccales bacterium]
MPYDSYQDTDSPTAEELQYFWDEYKYRHDLCWRTVYKISFAVVVLAAIPYVRDDLTNALNCWMLFPAGLGVLASILGMFVVWNELDRFAKIKTSYRHLQNLFWRRFSPNDKEKSPNSDIDFSEANGVSFRAYVIIYLTGLVFLGLVNVVFLMTRWTPCLEPVAACGGSA